MIITKLTRFVGVAALVPILLLSAGGSTFAETPPDNVIDLEAGQACNFALQIEILGGNHVYKVFNDKNDGLVRSLSAGKGSAFTFINMANDMRFSLKAGGSVTHTTNHADALQEVIVTGHELLILFPTDIPTGPSTTQYVGRVVFTVDPGGVFTLQSTSGQSTDICATLSQGG